MTLEDRILKLENSQKAIIEHFISVVNQFGELSKSINKEQVGKWSIEAVDTRQEEISKLASDCVKILNFLCDQGLVERKALNEVLR